MRVVVSIRAAKHSENHVNGQISHKLDFRQALTEVFLFDTGASVSIIGEKVAQDNQIHVTRLDTPRNIYEASGHPFNIIGECEFYVKLSVLGKVKRLTCLVLRGAEVDREILVSCSMLKKWDMIHETFLAQTLSDYIRNLAH